MPPPVRIMPMGDSITFGSGVAGGYRARLYQLLTAAGYNVDLVGSLNTNGVATLPDSDHEGHSGYRIDQIDTELAGYLAGISDPDVILLHIGTNDFGQGVDTPRAIDRLDALMTKITTARPFARLIVTNLMKRTATGPNTGIQTEFNPFVQARVEAQAALGRRVTFLDMHAAIPLTELRDGLHPNQAGYDHMAEVWFPAIQEVMGVNGDFAPPQIARARGIDPTHVAITFSKPVADAAAAAGNFAINGGITVSAAQLDASKRVVTLTTSAQVAATSYRVTIDGVVDRITPVANALPAGSEVDFISPTPRGYLNNVPEAADYTLVYSLDIATPANYAATDAPYGKDNRLGIGPFDRVAYYVELQSATGDLQYAWVSMDAFTADVNKIGVPAAVSQAVFQQAVTNLNVVSNVAGVTNGSGIAGNLEFWPNSYSAPNTPEMPGASATNYDFGDTRSTGGAYGSMQVHNTAAGQTIFGFNNWGGSTTTTDVDLGIGNNPAPVRNGVDWTFANNAAGYTVKSLQVLVRTMHDIAPPTITSVAAAPDGASIILAFSEPISADSIRTMNFSVSGGVFVIGATLGADQRTVILTTSQLPAQAITVSVSGVRDTSPSANLLVPVTMPVGAPALPPQIAANIGAPSNGYQLVATINLPVTGDLNVSPSQNFAMDYRHAPGSFTRVAYYLELQKPGGVVQYVWTSMDAFSLNRTRLCIPTVASGAVFQRNVTRLDVVSNVAGVTNGLGMAGGNIEFWPDNYTAANGAAVPGASATTYDFGDTRTTTAGSNDFGCMQVHDRNAGKTLFAINHFGEDGNTLDIGIGSQSTDNPDWTLAENAGQYSRRVLHVLVLPGVTAPAAVTAVVPEAAGYQLAATLNLPSVGNLQSGAGFKAYDVDNRAELGDFTRVAYYLELRKTGDTTSSFVWTSMDAFTRDATKIAVPTTASGAVFQQRVSRLNVVSNVPGIVNGTNIAAGNIEFFPSSYTTTNDLSVPAASGALYDFGDSAGTSAAGYGSMQVHNHGAGQTLWAINNWGYVANTSKVLCVGIGNNTAPVNGGVDWTFAVNADQYTRRLLHVLVLPGYSDTAPPLLTGVRPSTRLDRVIVSFSKPLADAAALAASYQLNGGLQVIGATLQNGNREVILTTTPQAPNTSYVLTVNGVRDRTPAANAIATNSTISFTSYKAPAVLANVPETADYKLVYQLAIPSASGKWNLNEIPYSVDETFFGEQAFDRVAYLLELGNTWAYASFDALTGAVKKIGVPATTVSTTPVQQNVSNLNVVSNVAGVVTGTHLTGGNIEFWGRNYTAPNAKGVPGASETLCDFGDTMLDSGGWGTLQIHNYEAAQTILAYNNWGGNTVTSELGIGNNPAAGSAGTGGSQGMDWTYAANAASYVTRNLYVLVRPGPSVPEGAVPEIVAQPTSRVLAGGSGTTLAVRVGGEGPFSYQWRFNGVPIAGGNLPWLDLTNLTSVQSGWYDVIVTGSGGATATSLAAKVAVANRLPVFAGYRFTTSRNTTAAVPLDALLARTTDADLNPLSVSAVVAVSQRGGEVSLGANSIGYTPLVDFTGDDSFAVTISDGQGGSISGNVQMRVSAVNLAHFAELGLVARRDGLMDGVFRGVAGQSYIVQRSLDLAGWADLQSVVAGDDGLLPFTDPNPPAPRAFYRLKPAMP